MKTTKMLLAVGMVLSLSLAVQADQITLVNGGFEAGLPAAWSADSIPGWYHATGPAAIALTGYGTEGDYALFVSTNANSKTSQYIQATDHVIQEGYTYTLSADACSWDGSRQFILVMMNAADQGYLAGGQWNDATDLVYGPDNTWRTYSASFTATAEDAGKTMALYFAVQGDNANRNAFVDNVVLEYTVPEPATMALLGVGGLVGLCRRRRK